MNILEKPLRIALDQTRGLLARSETGLRFVAKLRNQCELTIGTAHGWTIGLDPEVNGEARWFRTVPHDLQYVVDVGANKGEWTNLALSCKKVDHVLLLEPSLSAIGTLKGRFSAHPEVEIVEAAAGNCPGTLSFFEEEGAGETSSLVQGFSKDGKVRKVQITTIDAEIERHGWPFVDFLKIDAEGYDFRVLEGTQTLLRNGKVAYGQFEYNSPWRHSGTTLTYAIRWLHDLGYQCFLIKGDGLHVPNVDLYREYYLYSNYAFIRNDLVKDTLQRLQHS